MLSVVTMATNKSEAYARDKASTPINWTEDPFGEGLGGRDALDSVPFMDELQNEVLGDVAAPNVSSFMDSSTVLNGGNENRNDTPPSDPLKVSGSPIIKRNRGADVGTPISRRKKKPKGMPKRPLSAYNLYFQSARAKILEDAAENGDGGSKIGFEGLGKIIGKQWRVLTESERKTYEILADKDSVRYRKEMETYNEMKHKRLDESDKESLNTLLRSTDASPSPSTQPRQSNTDGTAHFAGLQALDLTNALSTQPPYGISMMEHASPSSHQIMNNHYAQNQQQSHHQQQQQLQAEQNHIHSYSYPPPSSSHQRVALPSYQHPQYGQDYGMSQQGAAGNSRPIQLSFPPLPPGADPVPPNQMPVPPGMEIILPDQTGMDRKYRVQYACYSMTKEAAHRYIENLSGLRPGSAAGGVTVEISQRHLRTFPASWGGAS